MQCNIDNLWPLLGIDLVRIHVKSGFGGRCLPRHAPDWVGVLQGSSHDFPLQGWDILMHGIIFFYYVNCVFIVQSWRLIYLNMKCGSTALSRFLYWLTVSLVCRLEQQVTRSDKMDLQRSIRLHGEICKVVMPKNISSLGDIMQLVK